MPILGRKTTVVNDGGSSSNSGFNPGNRSLGIPSPKSTTTHTLSVNNGSASGIVSSPSSAVSVANGSANHSVASSIPNYGFEDYANMLREISEQNNQFNLDQVKMVNEYNAVEAQKNRDWQERLSNTAHQREVEDLIKAGLNPVLSAGGQGAVTGSGAVASGQKAVADNIYGQGVMNLMQSYINAASAENVAKIYASASMYAADRGAAASMYGANTSAGASNYAANLNYQSQQNYQRILEENNIRTTSTSAQNNIRTNNTYILNRAIDGAIKIGSFALRLI